MEIENEKNKFLEIIQAKMDFYIEKHLFLENPLKEQKFIKNIINKRSMQYFKEILEENYFLEKLINIKEFNIYLFEHSINSSIICGLTGILLFLNDKTIMNLVIAGILHDYGKLLIQYNQDEDLGSKKQILKGSPHYEEHLNLAIQFFEKSQSVHSEVIEIIENHHENIDGSGFPKGLKNKDISMESKILAIADNFDYINFIEGKGAINARVDLIQKGKKYFDENIMSIFLRHFIPFPLTTLVRLNNNRIGVVEKINQADLSRPVIKIVQQIASKIVIEEVDLLNDTKIDIIEILEEVPNPSVQEYLRKGYN